MQDFWISVSLVEFSYTFIKKCDFYSYTKINRGFMNFNFIGKQKDPRCDHKMPWILYLFKSFAINSIYAFMVKELIDFFLTLSKTKWWVTSIKYFLNLKSAKFGFYIGLVGSLYRLVLCMANKKRVNSTMGSIIASIICCLIAIIDPNEYRRKTFLFYTTAKAFNIFLNFVNNPDLENLPKDSEMVIFLSLATFLVFLVYKVPCELPDISNPLGYKWYEYDLNLYLE